MMSNYEQKKNHLKKRSIEKMSPLGLTLLTNLLQYEIEIQIILKEEPSKKDSS